MTCDRVEGLSLHSIVSSHYIYIYSIYDKRYKNILIRVYFLCIIVKG
nr:MAG TPA: hypothetical protein [Caudoviricetes sp.]